MAPTAEEPNTDAARTHALHRCVEVAQVLARDEGNSVELSHLFLAAVFDGDPDTRARLVMRATGAHHFVTDDTYRTVAEAAARRNAATRAVPLGPAAAAVLSRVAHWTARTGDSCADTAHLMLACLERAAVDEEMRSVARTLGLTERIAVTQAMEVRQDMSPADRQSNGRGPILSRRRGDRPAPYAFEARHRAVGPRRGRNISLRSHTTSAEHAGSRVHAHLIRLHVWVWCFQQACLFVAVAAVIWSCVSVTAWAALWLVGLSVQRPHASPGVRLGIDAALVAASVLLAIPWPPLVASLACRVPDLLDGRLAVLELRADTGDPLLTERDLRADRWANRRAAGAYRWLKLQGRLTAE